MTAPYLPTPPRFRWLKRGAIAGCGLLALLTAVRLEWGHAAAARLAAARAAAHARGEPVTADDLADPPAGPDDRNAAAVLMRAAAGVRETGRVTDLAGTVATARSAVDLPVANWDNRVLYPAVGDWRGSVCQSQSALAQLLAATATVDHDAGNDAAAVRDVRAMCRQSAALAAGRPAEATQRVADAIDQEARDELRQLVADLNVARCRAEAKGLIGQLLDDRPARAGARRAQFEERLAYVAAAEHPDVSGSGFLRPEEAAIWGNVVTRPGLLLDAARAFDAFSALAAACDAPTLPAAGARAGSARVTPPASPLDEVADLLSRTEDFSEWPVRQVFRNLTERRAAAVLLALRLYEADHGRLPAALATLVPDYLPAVPVDPDSPAAAPLRYRLRSPWGATVYGVGEDGVDDGGSATLRQPAIPGETPHLWNTRDVVFTYTARHW